MSLKKIIVFTGTTLGMLLFASQAILAEEAALDSERLVVVLKAANELDTDSKLLSVYATGKRVTAMIQRKEIAADRVDKIDAMFIARTLFNAFPNDIDDVKVLFSTVQGHDGRVVSVPANLVSDFSAGKMSTKALMALLLVEDVKSESVPDVVQGPYEDRRLLIWHRIKMLQKGGTNVKPFLILFQAMEANVNTSTKNDIGELASNLEENLSDQEEQVKLARKAAAGRGVPASRHNSVTGSGSIRSVIAAGSGTTAGAGFGHSVAIPNGTTPGAGQSTAGGAALPPTTIAGLPLADFLNTGGVRFMECACQELEQRRDSDAQRYRDRKNRIEETHKYYDRSKAEADFADFKIEFLKKFGLTAPAAPVRAVQPVPWGQPQTR